MARYRRQRGVAALGMAVTLLVAMTVIAFFASRGLAFEQRSAANQYRSTRAFEAAEAGLEWAVAMLNDVRALDASCRPGAGAVSFRRRYAPPATGGAGFAPLAAARPGCSLSGSALECDCPAAGARPALDGDAPSFTVEIAAVPGDADSLRVTARGCSGRGTQCVPGSDQGPSDASAVAQVLLKLRPALRSAPAAALVAGGRVELDGSAALENTDSATLGHVALAGLAVTRGGAALVTLPGSPLANALVAHDATLVALHTADASGDAYFSAFFGSSVAQFARAPTTGSVEGCSGSACSAALQAAHAAGYRAFLVDGALRLDAAGWPGGSIGAPDDPVLIVATGTIGFDGAVVAHGLLYSHAADWPLAAGAALHGAAIGRGDVRATGSRIRYDGGVLQRLRHGSGVLARVPGSWIDGRCAQADPALACELGS